MDAHQARGLLLSIVIVAVLIFVAMVLQLVSAR
jgi:hypothetical protein